MDNDSFYKFLKDSLGFDYDPDLKLIQTKYFQKIEYKEDLSDLSQDQLSLFLLLLCYMNNKKFNLLLKLNFLQPFLKYIKKLKINQTHSEPSFSLNWTGNSCYIDSVLVSLFSQSNKIIQEQFFEKNLIEQNRKDIQEEIKNLYKRDNVKKLREKFKHFLGSQKFHGTGTQDAGEFLQYLFNIFNVIIGQQIRYTYISNDEKKFKLSSKIIDNQATPIVPIILTNLNKDKTYNLCSFIKQQEFAEFDEKNLVKYKGELYKYRLEITKYICPFIVFYIHRESSNHSFNKIKMIPSPFLITPSYSKLSLSAIVIHTGGAHYFCVYKYDEIWYEYDDMEKKKIKKIGSYKDMLKIDKSPVKYGTLFFYT